jgi:hypothetical protein
MHGNYPRPRREYWTDRKWARNILMRIVTRSIRTILNVRYGCRRIWVVYLSMLHRSKNTSSFKIPVIFLS